MSAVRTNDAHLWDFAEGPQFFRRRRNDECLGGIQADRIFDDLVDLLAEGVHLCRCIFERRRDAGMRHRSFKGGDAAIGALWRLETPREFDNDTSALSIVSRRGEISQRAVGYLFKLPVLCSHGYLHKGELALLDRTPLIARKP